MRQRLPRTLAIFMLALLAGCVSQPLVDGQQARPRKVPIVEANPVFIPLGPDAYGMVFENALTTLIDNGFEILESNRYDGRIETVPRVAHGWGFRSIYGSPSWYERTLSITQSYRHRVSVVIQPAETGGYFIEVVVRKELENLPRPLRATAGAAIFRFENNVERQFEVIDPNVMNSTWIYKGRDEAYEQAIICDLKKKM
jgi:hypothetical protein